jgi:uncharacterized membrane protein YphA (DoxX/SURF4 family)
VTGLVTACRFFVAIVFALSALPKLRNMGSFAVGIAAYRILPVALHRPFAWVAVLGELSAATLLLTPLSHLGALLALGLLAIYGIAVSINLAKGREIPCYCFDQGRSRLSVVTVLRLLLLMASTLPVYLTPTRYPSTTSEWLEVLAYLAFQLSVFAVMEVVQFALTTAKRMLKQF